MQQTKMRLRPQLANHAIHRGDDRQPFVDAQRLIDAHADEEDDELAVEGGG
jgi:hypothetical protein